MNKNNFFSRKKRLRRTICALLCGCSLTALAAGCGRADAPITQSGFYFDTVISVTLYDSSKKEELAQCFALADRYQRYFSATLADSDVSRINAAGGRPVAVHPETLELIQKGLTYAKISDGKFDITIGKLTRLWDFQSENPTVPSEKELAAAVATIDYRKVRIDKNTVALENPDAALDLGGIAKGYIADQMKEYLQSTGVTSGMINLGGNVLAIGAKQNGGAYTIGIQKPFADTGVPIASVKIKNKTVVSSGVYERCFESDGKRYHHILDVDTGYPYDNGLTGVSIICDNSLDGDGLSTTCFALGLDRGLALIESLPDTEAIFITSDGRLHTSSGIGTDIPMQKLQ